MTNHSLVEAVVTVGWKDGWRMNGWMEEWMDVFFKQNCMLF